MSEAGPCGHTHTHTHTPTRACVHTLAHTHTHTHQHTRARARAHTNQCARARTHTHLSAAPSVFESRLLCTTSLESVDDAVCIFDLNDTVVHRMKSPDRLAAQSLDERCRYRRVCRTRSSPRCVRVCRAVLRCASPVAVCALWRNAARCHTGWGVRFDAVSAPHCAVPSSAVPPPRRWHGLGIRGLGRLKSTPDSEATDWHNRSEALGSLGRQHPCAVAAHRLAGECDALRVSAELGNKLVEKCEDRVEPKETHQDIFTDIPPCHTTHE